MGKIKFEVNLDIHCSWNYVAQDYYGSIWAYQSQPKLSSDGWVSVSDESVKISSDTLYLGSDWKDSLHKIDHENGKLVKVPVLPDLEVDTPILVRMKGDCTWTRRYFNRFREDGLVVTYRKGETSWSSNGVFCWDEWKLPE